MLDIARPTRGGSCIPDALTATNLKGASNAVRLHTIRHHCRQESQSLYEDILGFEPIGSTLRGAQAFKVKGATVVIYESQFAVTNKATAVTWSLGEHFDEMVKAIDAKGVPFEHYEFPGIVLEGHVQVARGGKPSRVAWFKPQNSTFRCASHAGDLSQRKDVPVHREEIYERVQAENAQQPE
jgi:hypothetical protein